MRLTAKNYMCHRNLVIDIQDLSIITGPNGAGKSAIMHLIDWILEGGTNNHVTDGETECVGKLEHNGITIERVIDESGKYHLYYNGEEYGKTKEAVRDAIPEERIDIDFLNQFDGLYLLADRPGARLKEVNRLFDIEKVENAFNEASKDGRDLKKAKKIEEQNIKDVKLETESLKAIVIDLDSLDSISDNITCVENLKKYKFYKEDISQIKPLKLDDDLCALTNLIRFEKLKDIEPIAIEPIVYNPSESLLMLKRLKRFAKIDICYIPIEKLDMDIENIQENIELIDKMKRYKKYASKAPEKIEEIKIGFKAMSPLNMLKKYKELDDFIHKKDRELIGMKKELKENEKELSKYSCPTCGQIMGGL